MCEKLLILNNPEYYKKLKMGFWIGDTPKTFKFFKYDPIKNEIYTHLGVFFWLKEHFDKYEYEIIDNRNEGLKCNIKSNIELRDYQTTLIDEIIAQDCCVLVSGAGTGKTIMGLEYIARRGVKTLVLTHTTELVKQFAERAKEFLGEKCSIVKGKEWDFTSNIVIGSIQTVSKHIDQFVSENLLKDFGVLVIDEYHHICGSETWRKVLKNINTEYRLGLTATPIHSGGKETIMNIYAGPEITNEEKAKGIMKPQLYKIFTNFYVEKEPDKYQEMIEELVNDEDRNDLIVENILQYSDEPTIVLSQRKVHLEILREKLEGQISVRVMSGDYSLKERQEADEALKSGEINVLLATNSLLAEGYDFKSLVNLHLVTPQKWEGKVIQQIGRVARIAEGKDHARVFDYIDIRIDVLKYQYYNRFNKVYKKQLTL